MHHRSEIGFVGLGAMGLGMGLCLLGSGFDVTGFDIQQKAIERFVQEGGEVADTPRAAAANAEILVIAVATSDQTSSVLFDDKTGALATLPQNSIIVLCITARPEYVVGLRQRLNTVGRPDVRLIDCPISGGEVRARDGTLSLICAGEKSDIESAHDVLECLSSKLHIVPGGIGAGSGLKLVHQILVGINILASVEVMGLAYSAGLNLQSVYDSVMRDDGASWLFGQRAAHMLNEKTVPASSLAIIAKDMAMVTAHGRYHEFPLPLSSVTEQIYILAQSAKWEAGDDCVTLKAYLPKTGCFQSLRQPSTVLRSGSVIEESAVSDLLVGIHCAATIEVLRFARRLGLNTHVLAEFVKGAAGSSVLFNRISAQLEGNAEVALKRIDNFESIRQNLKKGIETAKRLNYPLFVASTALQQYFTPT